MKQNIILFFLIMASFTATICSNKQKISQDRFLPVEGAYNVRDMGGYQTTDGKTVKWGNAFRSGDLNRLTDKDLEYFASIPIITYIDFRDSAEISVAPDRKPISLKNQFFLPVETGSLMKFRQINAQSAPLLLVEGNKNMVRNNQDSYKRFFEILMNKEYIPVLFHCSAGKDRAGLAAALFLSSLGVDRETVIRDYLLTNGYLKDKYKAMIDSMPEIAPLLEARKEYIQAAFDVIDKEYGGMDNYLINYLNVDLDKMREIYIH